MFTWIELAVRSLLNSATANSKSVGGAFCPAFMVALGACLGVMASWGAFGSATGSVADVASVSGLSFAFAITVISLGRFAMLTFQFFRDPIKAARREGLEEGRTKGLEEGRERTIDGLRQLGIDLDQDQLDLLRADDKEQSDKPAGER